MSVFSRDAGTSTLGWRACSALRMRVSMSATRSVVIIRRYPPRLFLTNSPLPTRFDHARDFSRERQLPEADAAQLEFPQKPTRASAPETPVAMPAAQLRRPGGFRDRELFIPGNFGGSGHVSP